MKARSEWSTHEDASYELATEPTATPWTLSVHHGMQEAVIHGPEPLTHHAVLSWPTSGNPDAETAEANARRIVEAVNNYPALVAALRNATDALSRIVCAGKSAGSEDWDNALAGLRDARVVLAQAEGGAK